MYDTYSVGLRTMSNKGKDVRNTGHDVISVVWVDVDRVKILQLVLVDVNYLQSKIRV